VSALRRSWKNSTNYRFNPVSKDSHLTQPLRIIFAGTPEFAAASLRALLEENRHEVIAVYSQPDRPAGRGRELKASPVKELALAHHIPVFQPVSLKDPAAIAELAALKPDLMIVAAYGLILPQAVLDLPRLGCLNVHASLLPRWRGAAPIQRAILAGDTETGITIMQMDAGLDTGAMRYTMSCPIEAHDTGSSLHDKLAMLGGKALMTALDLLGKEQLPSTAQDASHSTYAAKLSKDEACLHWSQPALELSRAVRAYNAWPMAFTTLNGQVLRVWQARVVSATTATSSSTSTASTISTAPAGTIIAADSHGLRVMAGDQSVLQLEVLQLPGGKALSVLQLLNARREQFAPGQVLGE
jgi:methionyl-tRNA formyltransferase